LKAFKTAAANSGIAKMPATGQILSAFEFLLYFSNAAYLKKELRRSRAAGILFPALRQCVNVSSNATEAFKYSRIVQTK